MCLHLFPYTYTAPPNCSGNSGYKSSCFSDTDQIHNSAFFSAYHEAEELELRSLGIVAVVQSLSPVWLFTTPWAAAHQASLSFTVSRSLLKLVSIELVMPSNHLVLCRPLLPFVSLCTTKSTSDYLSAHSAQLECKPYGGRDFALLVYCCILRP